MGSPIPVVFSNDGFRSGFPSYTMCGPRTYSAYKLKLTNGVIITAVVMRDNDEQVWVRRNDNTRVPAEDIVGWQDDVVCAEYVQVIERWAQEPYGLINKSNWAHTLGRHIANREGATLAERITCEACARKFVAAWRAKHGEIPEGWEAYA